jgi:plastocyanin
VARWAVPLVVWLAAACSGAPSSPTTVPTPTATVVPAPRSQRAVTAPKPASGAVVIEAAEQYFNPELVTVTVGTTVVWNDVQGTHDMVADDRSFASAVLIEGGKYSHTFNSAGRYRYICTLHVGAGMWAEVDVVLP